MKPREIKPWWLTIAALAIGLVLIWWLYPYFSGARLINHIFISIGYWQIRWYGLIIAIAVLLGWRWLEKLARGTALSPHTLDLVIWTTLGGIMGARLLFVILKWPEFAGNLNQVWNLAGGGLSIHGALIGGALAIAIYCQRHRLPLWQVLDLMVPPLVLGQLIGRLGNFFNQEAFGGPTSVPWKMWVAPVNRPPGLENFSYFHPTFLYEMLGLALILGLILWLRHEHRTIRCSAQPESACWRMNGSWWRQRSILPGQLFMLYLLGYGVVRFIIEFYRIDSDYWQALTVAQWGSILIIMGTVVIGLILKYKRKL